MSQKIKNGANVFLFRREEPNSKTSKPVTSPKSYLLTKVSYQIAKIRKNKVGVCTFYDTRKN